MRGVIFGSGLVGLIAKKMLGDNWTVIPFSRSRFFSFRPALNDNFLIHDERTDDFVGHLGGKLSFIYKVLYSLNGGLFEYQNTLSDTWLAKVFGTDIPPHSDAYLSQRKNFFVYDLKLNALYESLQKEYLGYLIDQSKMGKVTEIGDHYAMVGNQRIEFDKAVSTIPLNLLCQLSKQNRCQLPSQQIWYFHIETKDLDFEGANQVLVVDPEFDFFKVANIANNRYLFYCKSDIQMPGAYFMQFMRKFDLLDGTTIESAIPKGPTPKLDAFEKMGIYCVGNNAQWDWCMDISSCILRLLKIKPNLVSV